jgi:hypothetical protein
MSFVIELQNADASSRWILSEIQADCFRWREVESLDGGIAWKTVQEM